MRIHDPDVVYTDLALAILGAYLAWRLWRHAGEQTLTRGGVVIMGALASAALWGAVFHAFFPDNTATTAGFIAWIPVSLSILVVATALLAMALHLLIRSLSTNVRRVIIGAYAVAFAFVVLLVDESYSTIVRFYAPTLILFLIAAARQAMRRRGGGWWLVALSFAISIVAAVMQQLGIAIHPVYFDHNALYHVLQGIALVLLYVGFKRASRPDRAYSPG